MNAEIGVFNAFVTPDSTGMARRAAGVVSRVVRRVDCNVYLRRQAPSGVRISRRPLGRDHRYPITSEY